jgi:hypothetical protein
MLVAALVHSVNDGLTVSSCGVAVGVTIEGDRQAGAQGLLGGVQTLVGGLTAIAAGWEYEHFGRRVSYGACGVGMAVLVVAGVVLAGPERIRGRVPVAQRTALAAELP